MFLHIPHRGIKFTVFRRGVAGLFGKCTVEGAKGIKSDVFADLGDAEVGVDEHFAGFENAQRVDIIVETDAELFAEKMGDVIFIQVELFFQKREGEVFRKILGTEGDDRAQSSRISHGRTVDAHVGKQLGEKCQQTAAPQRAQIFVSVFFLRANISKQFKKLTDTREVCGISDHGGLGNPHCKGFHQLGHHIGLDDGKEILFCRIGVVKVDLIREGQKYIARVQDAAYRIGISCDFTAQHIYQFQIAMEMRRTL